MVRPKDKTDPKKGTGQRTDPKMGWTYMSMYSRVHALLTRPVWAPPAPRPCYGGGPPVRLAALRPRQPQWRPPTADPGLPRLRVGPCGAADRSGTVGEGLRGA